MALLSLDRHDVLETIRQSNSLHEAFLQVAKLPAVGEYRTATNADRIRAMTDEELAELLRDYQCNTCDFSGFCDETDKCKEEILEWLQAESGDSDV